MNALLDIRMTVERVADLGNRLVTLEHGGQVMTREIPWPYQDVVPDNNPFVQLLTLRSMCYVVVMYPGGAMSDDFRRLGLDAREILHVTDMHQTGSPALWLPPS